MFQSFSRGSRVWGQAFKEWSKADGASWAGGCYVDEGHHVQNFPSQVTWCWTYSPKKFYNECDLLARQALKFPWMWHGFYLSTEVYAKDCWSLWYAASIKRSGLAEDDHLEESVSVHLAAVKSRKLRESLDNWHALPGLPSSHTFQEHMASYLCVLHQHSSVNDLERQLPYDGWSKVWRGCVESMNVDVMLVQWCGATSAGCMKSTVEHTLSGMGWFCLRTGWEGNVDRIL